MRSMLAVLVLVLAWPVVAADPTFDGTVAPFFKAHCAKCHGDTDPQAGLTVSALDPNPATAKDPDKWNDVRLRLLAGEMPPEKEARPKAAEVAPVVGWIEAELKKNPKVKLRQPPDFHHPRFGNRVDHEGLFDPAPGTVASTPQRVWRLGATGYETLLDDLRKREYGFIQPFGVAAEGFTEYAARLLADEAVALQLIRNAEQAVEYQCSVRQKKGKPTGVQPVKELVTLAGATAITRPQMEAAVRTQFKLVLLREPTADETKRFADLMAKATADTGHPLGLKTALAAVLLTPEALYRTEFGEGKPDEHGRLRLASREIAFALAFALTDKRPDAELLAVAEAGKLSTREGVAEQVKRLLNDPKTDKPRVLRFFREYFGYAAATEVFKNPEDFKDHSPYALVRDTDHLVEYILSADKNVLVELLTTRKSYVGILQEPGKKRNFADSDLLKGHAYPSYNLTARPDTASHTRTR